MDGRIRKLQLPALPNPLRRRIAEEENVRKQEDTGLAPHGGLAAGAADGQALRPGVLVDRGDDIHRPSALVITDSGQVRMIMGSAPQAFRRECATSR